jgi:predicted CopG family antitoxin
MGTKTIRLEESVYERLRELKGDDETYSEAVERLLPEGSLLELAGIFTEEEAREIEDRLGEKYAESKASLRENVDAEP